MAEITLAVSFLVSKLGASASCVQSTSIDLLNPTTPSNMSTETVTVGTSEVAVPIGNVATGGFMAIKNLSSLESALTVRFGLTATDYANMLFGVGPKETIIFRNFVSAGYLYAKASAAGALIEVVTVDP